MSQVEQYLQVVPWPLLVLAAVGLPIALLVVPPTRRLEVTLVALVLLLTTSRLSGLGFAQALAKAAVPIGHAVLVFAAWTTPGFRQKIPAVLYLYPVTAVLGALAVVLTSDVALALALQFSWFLATLAALSITRHIVDRDHFQHFVLILGIGLSLALLLPASSVGLDPSGAFRTGHRRFTPYDANPNQIGTLFILAPPILLYCALTTLNRVSRAWFVATAAIAVGMGVITASRSVIFTLGIILVPFLFLLARRPGILALVIAIGSAGWAWIWTRTADLSKLSRLGSLESLRYDIALDYIGLIISRPLGLLGVRGESTLVASDIGHNPHNAYLQVMYVGGLPYGLPILALQLFATYAAYSLWFRRDRTFLGTNELILLIALQSAFLLQGLTTAALYHPTYTWALANLIFSSIAITLRLTSSRPYQPLELSQAPPPSW